MPVSLHDVIVGAYLQALPQVARLVDKAEAHCREHGLEDEALTAASLAPDMWPFAKQVFECGHHSARAIVGVREGVFRPEIDPVPSDFATLKAEVAGALALVEAVEPGELDAMVGRDMLFEFGEMRIEYTVENFLLSFTLPNFYFHVAAAYSVLRNQGLPVGKRDYLGRVRRKR